MHLTLTSTPTFAFTYLLFIVLTVSTVVCANLRPNPQMTVTTSYNTAVFDATSSSDPDGNITAYMWTFGETGKKNNTATTPVATHTYPSGGQYMVTLTVTDNSGGSKVIGRRVGVTDANKAPIADFSCDVATATVTCTAKGLSFDSDGQIVSYTWNFGDSGSSTNTATGEDATHTYSTSGQYTVSLQVTDDGGLTNSTSHSVDIIVAPAKPKTPPIAAIDYDTFQNQFTFNCKRCSDADGKIVAYEWKYGDQLFGSQATASLDLSGAAQDTTVTITLILTDDDGLTATVSSDVYIYYNSGADLRASTNGRSVTYSTGYPGDKFSWTLSTNRKNFYGETTVLPNITYTFSEPGIYTQGLRVYVNNVLKNVRSITLYVP